VNDGDTCLADGATVVPDAKAEEASFTGLKSMARKLLPRDSALRKRILSESDRSPRWLALSKIEEFSDLLYEELRAIR
jgi:hypothetical protein